jgi:hypothetical protein
VIGNAFSRSHLGIRIAIGTETDLALRDATESTRKMSDKIRSYDELRELIRVSLRIQNPEWVEPNGDSPVCDSYEARFAELLGLPIREETTRRTHNG